MHCVGCYVYGDVIATSNLVVDIREWNRKCVCVCWVFGEEKEDSPRWWEAYADLTACGCLVVQSVCIINC